MKYLKKFEELSPEIYRRVGVELIKKGHTERGLDVLDKSYGDSFNVWIAKGDKFLTKDWINNTDKEPVSTTYNFVKSEFNFFPRNMAWEFKDTEMDAEKLVEFWKEGKCDLGFNIDFYFVPTKETTKRLKLVIDDINKPVALFSINFTIEKRTKDLNVNIQDYFYNKENNLKINLRRCSVYDMNNGTNKQDYFGLFSDRKSVIKFIKNIMPKVMDENSDNIIDIYSILGEKSSIVEEEVLDAYKKFKVNYFYRSEIPHYVGDDISRNNIEYFFFDINKEKDIRE